MLYVFYITTTPYLPCNNNNINRKELYDFYCTAITLTTGYKHVYDIAYDIAVKNTHINASRYTIVVYTTYRAMRV